MNYKKFDNKYVVRIDKGEEVVESLKKFCKEENIRLASVTAIGAADKIILGLFKSDEKKYYSKEYEGDYEITGLNGNISTMDGEVYIHLHITIAGEDNTAIGGHLNSAVISGTCEMFVDVLAGEADRIYDEESGLNVFKLD
ncbi:PPC domain-containing DNA-binding protein [Caldisalinibacter kiritimatiensis]|uniref:PPC domain-containing protein n=1 Tax=Caldisalinibacter kiritimatiensis TaxID=1304284 RepID=R1CR70_9FIRM|nr:PPC domain-containing DNA-binding protein [Caldisalinibacter kiritimatiensis]EOD01176.1 hypothetical protein L21TH_0715 [Caldisalinibacter kiritimatiensis]